MTTLPIAIRLSGDGAKECRAGCSDDCATSFNGVQRFHCQSWSVRRRNKGIGLFSASVESLYSLYSLYPRNPSPYLTPWSHHKDLDLFSSFPARPRRALPFGTAAQLNLDKPRGSDGDRRVG